MCTKAQSKTQTRDNLNFQFGSRSVKINHVFVWTNQDIIHNITHISFERISKITKSMASKKLIATTLEQFALSLKQPHIIGICGSNRDLSFNAMLLRHALSVATEMGATTEIIDLSSLNLPVYDPNLEATNFPPEASVLKAKLTAADGILITCPEYNGFVTPLLLNALTWATRGQGGMYDAFKGQPIAVLSTSPGAMGGLRMQRSFMTMLSDMGAVCIPSHCTLGKAMAIFKDGTLTDERSQQKVSTAVGQLLHFSRFEANRDQNCAVVQHLKRSENAGEYGRVD